MAVRERQLGALGMRSNERGQVTAQCSLTQQVADLAEEAGAVCCICREGYKYQPTKASTRVYTGCYVSAFKTKKSAANKRPPCDVKMPLQSIDP